MRIRLMIRSQIRQAQQYSQTSSIRIHLLVRSVSEHDDTLIGRHIDVFPGRLRDGITLPKIHSQVLEDMEWMAFQP